MDKIRLINRSLRCFVLGLIGLVPIVGLPFALAAFIYGIATQRIAKGQVNPANRYLFLGRLFGLVGCLLTVCICAIGWYISANKDMFWPSGDYT